MLGELEEKWNSKYPFSIKSWDINWDVLSPFFKYPNEIRTIMYTTNIIKSLRIKFKKVTKTKSVFPSDQSFRKMLYLASQNVMKKWSRHYKNWDYIFNQLVIYFERRIEPYL